MLESNPAILAIFKSGEDGKQRPKKILDLCCGQGKAFFLFHFSPLN
jgi:ubiquinone/menaquinone biosynthesis C-methylase UbiE